MHKPKDGRSDARVGSSYVRRTSVSTRYATAMFLLLVMLTGMSSAGPSRESYASSVCLSQNPVIQMLSESGVEMYDKPQDSHSRDTCKWEWQTHKTCCDADSLQKYAVQDIEKLQKAISKVGENMLKLLIGLKKNNQRISVAYKNAGAKKGKQQSSVQTSVPLSAEELSIQKDMATLSEMITRNLGDKKLDTAVRDVCFNRIKDIRTSSFCASCSGQSARLFLQGRALISMQDCRITLQKCGEVWARSIEIMDAVVMAERVVNYLKVVIPDEKLPKFSEKDSQTLQKFMGEDKILAHLKSCKSNSLGCQEDSAVYLCETFISLEEKEYIEKADAALSKTADSWQQAGVIGLNNSTNSNSQGGNNPYNPNNWRVGRLLMTSSGSSIQVVRDTSKETINIQSSGP